MQTKSWKIPNPHFSDYLCCFGLPAIPNGPKRPIWAYLGQIWPIRREFNSLRESSTLSERVQLSETQTDFHMNVLSERVHVSVSGFVSLRVGSCLWDLNPLSETWTHSQRHELTLGDLNSLLDSWTQFPIVGKTEMLFARHPPLFQIPGAREWSQQTGLIIQWRGNLRPFTCVFASFLQSPKQ